MVMLIAYDDYMSIVIVLTVMVIIIIIIIIITTLTKEFDNFSGRGLQS